MDERGRGEGEFEGVDVGGVWGVGGEGGGGGD